MITYDTILNANTYNVAFSYLKNQGYTTTSGYTYSFREQLRKCKTKKEYFELEKTATDNCREIVLKPNLTETDFKTINDYEIYLLVKQYSLGIGAKKDLYDKLISIGLLEN